MFDDSYSVAASSILNMFQTVFILVTLLTGTIYFSKATNELVLRPIDSMISKIEEISKNPIEAAKKEYKQDLNKRALETAILEQTISKIGSLLALGFGEAGSEIISKNMKVNDNGQIDPMIPGKKVVGIYGFCDIRKFTDTTEVLEEKVMIFVNEIAEVVHSITAENKGSANKNIGDAFLLVWKLEQVQKEAGNNLKVVKCDENQFVADSAVIAFIQIIYSIHISKKLQKYKEDPELNLKHPGYSVKMGFGLHLGWSIEGAIGSKFKIDASYLGPEVNVSSKLEEKTKEYGTEIILRSFCKKSKRF